jgi:hypothetical protein
MSEQHDVSVGAVLGREPFVRVYETMQLRFGVSERMALRDERQWLRHLHARSEERDDAGVDERFVLAGIVQRPRRAVPSADRLPVVYLPRLQLLLETLRDVERLSERLVVHDGRVVQVLRQVSTKISRRPNWGSCR